MDNYTSQHLFTLLLVFTSREHGNINLDGARCRGAYPFIDIYRVTEILS
jgi:hypothetical protein